MNRRPKASVHAVQFGILMLLWGVCTGVYAEAKFSDVAAWPWLEPNAKVVTASRPRDFQAKKQPQLILYYL